MARESYRKQLDELRERVLSMSDVVLERLQLGLDALEQKDEDLAWEVIEGDHEVNTLYLDLEQECIDLLALQQPVASDLRFIAASFKIITDLERVADLATNLGEYTRDAERDGFPEVDIRKLGSMVFESVEDAMSAYEAADVQATYEIANRDDEIDGFCDRAARLVVRDLIETRLDEGGDEEEVERLLTDVSRLLLTIRDLERIGDHAVNIAARTLYMAENDDELIY